VASQAVVDERSFASLGWRARRRQGCASGPAAVRGCSAARQRIEWGSEE